MKELTNIKPENRQKFQVVLHLTAVDPHWRKVGELLMSEHDSRSAAEMALSELYRRLGERKPSEKHPVWNAISGLQCVFPHGLGFGLCLRTVGDFWPEMAVADDEFTKAF
jgi:hypothetical protein